MAEQFDKQEQDTGFMQRWSRRKIEVQSKTTEELEQEKNPAISVPAELKVEEYKTDADMPPIDQLTEESDFSDFLSPKVSELLRKQALRKLFQMPSMNIVDGLDDYAEDYTKFEALGDIIPHEMKRMLDREKAQEEQRVAEAAEAEQALNNEGAGDLESTAVDVDIDTEIEGGDESAQQSQLSAENTDQQEIIQAQQSTNHKDIIENEKLN